MDRTWLIGGPQGSGINASAEGFAKACVHAGYRVIANIEYHSNIMGEHSFYRVRVGMESWRNVSERVHVLVALDDETLAGDRHAEFAGFKGHVSEVVPGGAVVYDSMLHPTFGRTDVRLCPVPYEQLLIDALRGSSREGQANLLRVMFNTVAVGASLALLGFDLAQYEAVLRRELGGRHGELGELNVRAARLGYEYAQERHADSFPFALATVSPPERPPLFLKGVHAAAIAKLKAGLAIQTYYPISPASDESAYLEAQEHDQGVLVVQTEDEVSAINMAVGAAHAGVRASTSTSGPGFSLMMEGMGFAAMTEAPGPVVVLWQRGGPSTGLPTREEQGDLRLALQPGHGEFPHIVVAPGDVGEIVADTYEAFNWADRYQVPVVVLADKTLASTLVTADSLGLDALPPVDHGPRFAGPAAGGDYLRYAWTDGPVSPRAVPGEEGGVFWATTDEHDVRGHVTEDAANRIRMQEKRLGKLDLILAQVPRERTLSLHGPGDAELTLVGWGSTKGPLLDALEILSREDGLRANLLLIRLLRPFPAQAVREALQGAHHTILVEVNYLGQMGLLIREQTGLYVDQRILKYDGRPFTQEELVDAVRTAWRGGGERVVVSHLSA